MNKFAFVACLTIQHQCVVAVVYNGRTCSHLELAAGQTCGGLGNNTVDSVQTRIGCREVLYCSGVGIGVEWRRFGSRILLGNATNRIVTTSSVSVHGPMQCIPGGCMCVPSCNSHS